MLTYFDQLPHEINVLIISYIEYEDLSSISDIIHIFNLDYMTLLIYKNPNFFPIKFIYGDTMERYDWRQLYIDVLKTSELIFPNYNINICSFMLITGKLSVQELKTNKLMISHIVYKILMEIFLTDRIYYLSKNDFISIVNYCVSSYDIEQNFITQIMDDKVFNNMGTFVIKNQIGYKEFNHLFDKSVKLIFAASIFDQNDNWVNSNYNFKQEYIDQILTLSKRYPNIHKKINKIIILHKEYITELNNGLFELFRIKNIRFISSSDEDYEPDDGYW